MIDPRELRLGNVVNYRGNWNNRKGLTVLDESLFAYLWEVGDEWDVIEPVPLEKEWLVEFGFINGELQNFSFTEYMDLRIIGNENDYNGLWIGRLDYVHELQNLYFSLTREELNYYPKTTPLIFPLIS